MQDFMKGRYGMDELSLSLGALGILVALIGMIGRWGIVSIIALIIIVLAIVRALSKNAEARERENRTFRQLTAKVPAIDRLLDNIDATTSALPFSTSALGDLKRQARTAKKMWSERKTKAFLKCPTCGTMLAVPKGKGRLIVTCPKCRTKMETRS